MTETTTALKAALWDDNPSTVDVLGFDVVVAAVKAALRHERLDPITIGVHAPWGGGKSTVLGLIEASAEPSWIVVRTNPWEYDDQLDPKGTLINEVLAKLQEEISKDQGLKDKVAGTLKRLKERVSWSRFGVAVASGVLTMQWDPEKIISAFNPDADDSPATMAKFKDDFAELLDAMPNVERVVVLVDDLDRCLPSAVMATLEAIKLFLSVEKMAFVIAADQEMVQDAIAASLEATRRGERFAERYLEKIVQLPISLPHLSPVEAEGYIGLLLTHAEHDGDGFDELVRHVANRRHQFKAPLLAEMKDLPKPPSEETLRLASQLAQGLGPSRMKSPREIKRFLNAYGVRSQIAAERGVRLSPAVIVKLLLLEDRYRPDFNRLAVHEDRVRLIREWETWAASGEGEPPEGIRAETRDWARSEPSLADEPIDAYITLAATLVAAQLGSGITDELRALVRSVLGESEADRRVAAETIAGREPGEQRRVIDEVVSEGRRADTTDVAVAAVVRIGEASPGLASEIAEEIEGHFASRLEPSGAADIAKSNVQAFKDLTRRLLEGDALPADARSVIEDMVRES